jgi:hypothetical protein
MNIRIHTPLHPTAGHRTLAMLTCLATIGCVGPGEMGASSSFGHGPSVAETGDEDSDEETSAPMGSTGAGDGGATGGPGDTSDPDGGPGPGGGSADEGATSSDPTAGSATSGTEPECNEGSTCCASGGVFVPEGGKSPGCNSECDSCDGQGGCEPLPSGFSCGGGVGTCDGSGGCNVPTCNDGSQSVEPGEQCDGDNLDGESCLSQGFDGGSLTCQADCTFDTGECYQESIVPSRGLGSWTPAFVQDTSCTCGPADPYCHTLYRGRVTSIVGNVAEMEFQKADGSNPSVDITYWVVVGDLAPTCDDIDAYVQRTSGTWQSSDATLQVDVNIWPNPAAFDAAPCGEFKDLFVITGGMGDPDTRIWYQKQAVRFTKVCG